MHNGIPPLFMQCQGLITFLKMQNEFFPLFVSSILIAQWVFQYFVCWNWHIHL